jgi:HK97 family phage portal protein
VNPIERVIAFAKQFRMRHVAASGSWGLSSLGLWSDPDAVNVEPAASAIVQATVLWLGRAFPEAPLRVQQRDRKGRLTPLEEHPLTSVIATPNPYYSGVLLWQATIADWMLAGNAYWGKVRSGAGRPVELWWLPARTVTPVAAEDSSRFVDYYEYRPGGSSAPVKIDPADLVHFRYGMDPRDPRRGLSPLGALLREVLIDEEAQRFSAAILRNLGVPGVVLSPAEELSKEGAQQVKDRFRDTFSGSRRGDVLVTRGKMDVSVVSFSPEQMNLTSLRRLPEERISAVLGIPAIVVGLGAGLDRSTFSNFEEARQAAYESNVIPTQRLLGSEIQTQLLPDFGDPARLVVDFDLGQVRVLQPDQDALWRRLDVGVQGGWVMLNEARAQVGLDPLPDGDVVYVGVAKTPTAPDALLVEAEPLPEPTPLRALPPPEQRQQAGLVVPATKAATTAVYAAGIERIRARHTPPLERQIALLLRRQQRDVTSALLAREKAFDPADVFDVVRATATLSRALQRVYRRILGDVVPLVEATLGVPADPDPPAVVAYLAKAGQRIGGITETTREAVAAALQESARLGESTPQTAARIAGLGVWEPSRATTIARTEVGTAANLSSLASFRASSVVVGVLILDGDDCGLHTHDGEPKANGMRVPLDRMGDVPALAHPRCVRAMAPLTAADALEGAA